MFPWVTTFVGLLVAGWDFATHGEGPLTWFGLGTAAGATITLIVHKWLGLKSPESANLSAPHGSGMSHCRNQARARSIPHNTASAAAPLEVAASDSSVSTEAATSDCDNLRALVDGMLAEGRYALLLRPQIAVNLSAQGLGVAQETLDREMSLVPDGDVLLEPQGPVATSEKDRGDHEPERPGRVVHVASAYLDRFPVTNAQFQTFVLAGGYKETAIWDAAIWPAVFDLVDTTGSPGPRYWRDGRFPEGKENHPVVGICWYEAAAYARWVGKRLPVEAEWVKAGSWPVHLTPTSRVQRKYPWGNTINPGRANLWGSGPGDTVPVDELAAGESVGGIYQLIGNVWEWMADDFMLPHDLQPDRAHGPTLKSLRGGAFDTYFDQQSTCQFASGDNPLARKHNIGFRLALGICDLVDPTDRAADPPVHAVGCSEWASAEVPVDLAPERREVWSS
jgi:iron(II)-dependent oxidoreductase